MGPMAGFKPSSDDDTGFLLLCLLSDNDYTDFDIHLYKTLSALIKVLSYTSTHATSLIQLDHLVSSNKPYSLFFNHFYKYL